MPAPAGERPTLSQAVLDARDAAVAAIREARGFEESTIGPVLVVGLVSDTQFNCVVSSRPHLDYVDAEQRRLIAAKLRDIAEELDA